jgi:hypothetical protein
MLVGSFLEHKILLYIHTCQGAVLHLEIPQASGKASARKSLSSSIQKSACVYSFFVRYCFGKRISRFTSVRTCADSTRQAALNDRFDTRTPEVLQNADPDIARALC